MDKETAFRLEKIEPRDIFYAIEPLTLDRQILILKAFKIGITGQLFESEEFKNWAHKWSNEIIADSNF